MARLSITVDEKLVEEARGLAGAKTKRAAIEQALREFVQRRRLARLADLMGSDLLDMDLDDLKRWRQSSISDS